MRYFIFILSSLLLSGCAFKNNTPAIDTYTLINNKVGMMEIKNKKFSDKTLKVEKPTSRRDVQSTRILYAKKSYERDAYAYGRWSDTPNVMLQNNFVYALGESKLFKTVLLKRSSAEADYILESNLDEFYHAFVTPESSVGIITLDVHLIERQKKKVIASKRFSFAKDAGSQDIKGGVEALNNASTVLTRELIVWLKSLF
ncbi:membrane integrity-associated transporter subunit PqiC [bacterium]|nr:membrane integrity-associated transporter subunit PqiC [bacterium]MBU1956847.1 membrane integrity-associated transporter subunit PqiC [bacterium]